MARSQGKRPCELEPPDIRPYVSLPDFESHGGGDLTFVDSTSKRKVRVHRSVLGMASPVFSTMFEGNWVETNAKVLPISEEVDWEAFCSAVSIIYNENITLLPEKIPEIYKVANFYDISRVREVIGQDMSKMDMPLIISLCGMSVHLEPHRLDTCEVFQEGCQCLLQQFSKISTPPSCLSSVPYEVMQKILQSDDVDVGSELELFSVVVKWTKSQLDLLSLQQISKLFEHIRYGVISYDQLITTVAQEEFYSHVFFAASLQMHLKSVTLGQLKENIVQITPRKNCKEKLQFLGMGADIIIGHSQEGAIFGNVQDENSVAFLYFGEERKKVKFTVSWDGLDWGDPPCLKFLIQSLEDPSLQKFNEVDMLWAHASYNFCFLGVTPSGLHFPNSNKVSFSDPLPWVVSFSCDTPNVFFTAVEVDDFV